MARRKIPIVFTIGGDPVRLGVVQSLARPGGNATGIIFLTADLMPKRFELLRELVPQARQVALMVNPNTPSAREQVEGSQAFARAAVSACTSSMPAAKARSMPGWPRSRCAGRMRCCSAPTRSSPPVRRAASRGRGAPACRRSTRDVTRSPAADS